MLNLFETYYTNFQTCNILNSSFGFKSRRVKSSRSETTSSKLHSSPQNPF
ncbi:hypothetical protein Hdeb2414_s0001g00019631 [Helianthus debilis subsp. tardiflorus]